MAGKNKILTAIVFLFLADILVWADVFSDFRALAGAEIYFLDVGQGDSELIVFPEGAKIMIDGGPGKKAVSALDSAISGSSRYIDLMILSHPETDHFSGLAEVLKTRETGAFVWSGRMGEQADFRQLIEEIEKQGLKSVAVSAGDKIRQGDSVLEILSPQEEEKNSLSANESSLVIKFSSGGSGALFVGDIGFKMEKELLANCDLSGIDILKVAHHGSKYSSGQDFLTAVSPALAVIEVGKNSYGHPTKEVLGRLASIGARIFRTDQDGTVKAVFSENGISIFKLRE